MIVIREVSLGHEVELSYGVVGYSNSTEEISITMVAWDMVELQENSPRDSLSNL